MKFRLSKSKLPSTKFILSILFEIGRGTINSFFPEKYSKKYGYSRRAVFASLTRLKKKGIIIKNDDLFCLTKKGEKEAFYSFINRELLDFELEKQKWDGKWRFVFFDVPEKKRRQRDYLRILIRTVGFKEYQKSIWAYPYKIPKFLEEVLWEEQIKPYVRFLVAEKLDYDKDLRVKFHL